MILRSFPQVWPTGWEARNAGCCQMKERLLQTWPILTDTGAIAEIHVFSASGLGGGGKAWYARLVTSEGVVPIRHRPTISAKDTMRAAKEYVVANRGKILPKKAAT
jgi:hypothetical protein